MNRFLLFLVMIPSGLWKGMGADLQQLRAILRVKLMMDDRKPMGIGRQKSGKKNRFTSVFTVIISFFMGILYMLPLFISLFDSILALTLFYTLFIFFLTFTLVTDFSNAMVDARDKYIIFPKPVNDKTIFLSKMLHIFIYLLRIVVPMSLPGWITFSIIKGWKAAVWFPFPLLLMIFIALFLVNAVYLVLIKLTKPGRFKEIINYFQIAFSIVFFASYYLLPRFIDEDTWSNINILEYGWLRWLPPYWLAALWSWVEPGVMLAGTKWLSILALVFPAFCLWVTIKFLAPNFINNITSIDGAASEEGTQEGKQQKKGSTAYRKIASSINTTEAAKAGFIITWLQTSRSRSFKMRVYPLFAYIPVYFAYLLLSGDTEFSNVLETLPGTKSHLLLLYMTAFVLLQSINYITMSDQYKAAWVYHAAPLSVPGHVLGGAFKAMWIKYFLPFMAVIGGFVIWVWGWTAILDVVLASVNVTLFTVAAMRIAYRAFPFSMLEQMNNTGGKAMFRVLFTFILIGALGFGHYVASLMWWLKLLFLVLSAIMLWLVWDSYRGTDWKNLKAAEEE